MTSAVALALMAKASAVFGGDDTFLSFPLTPIGFSKEQLDFLGDTAQPSASLENASQFAFIVNQIPSGPVWPTVESGPLWQEYTRILEQAQLANEQRSPAEEAQYQAALSFLYVTDADGVQSPSPAVVAYNQYRDAYLAAKQQYTSRKIAADLSSDPAVKEQWAADEPALQAAVANALTAWQTLGSKGQVDDARRVEQSLAAKSPSITWSHWLAQCDPDTVALTDLENRQFLPTAFAPASAIDSSQWQQFSLGAGEVAQLVAQAPQELAARLADDQSLTIESIAFECTSVTVTRPWFSSDIFDARFWRLNAPPDVVSDGQTPASGTIPSYTVAIVFARNLEVNLGSPAPAANGNAPITLGPLHVTSIVDRTGMRFVLPRPIVAPIVVQRLEPRPFVSLAAAATAIAPRPALAPAALARLRNLDYVRIAPPQSPSPQQPTPQPQPQPPASTNQGDEQIFVLGFICKRTPRSPNPDASLSW